MNPASGSAAVGSDQRQAVWRNSARYSAVADGAGRHGGADCRTAIRKRETGGTDAQKAAARAQVSQAQAQLQKLLGDERTRALAAAQVKQAELNLEAAKQRLKDAVLTSPIAGTVSELNVKPANRWARAHCARRRGCDLSSFHIERGHDENSIGALQKSNRS